MKLELVRVLSVGEHVYFAEHPEPGWGKRSLALSADEWRSLGEPETLRVDLTSGAS